MASFYQRFSGKINTGSSFPVPPEASRLLGQGEPPAGLQPRRGSRRCEDEDVRRFSLSLITTNFSCFSSCQTSSILHQLFNTAVTKCCISSQQAFPPLFFFLLLLISLFSLLAARRSARVRPAAPPERPEFSEAAALSAVLKRRKS